jgi:hypothetical protein
MASVVPLLFALLASEGANSILSKVLIGFAIVFFLWVALTFLVSVFSNLEDDIRRRRTWPGYRRRRTWPGYPPATTVPSPSSGSDQTQGQVDVKEEPPATTVPSPSSGSDQTQEQEELAEELALADAKAWTERRKRLLRDMDAVHGTVGETVVLEVEFIGNRMKLVRGEIGIHRADEENSAISLTLLALHDPIEPTNDVYGPLPGNRYVGIELAIENSPQHPSPEAVSFSVQLIDDRDEIAETALATRDPEFDLHIFRGGERAMNPVGRFAGFLVFELRNRATPKRFLMSVFGSSVAASWSLAKIDEKGSVVE